jgi:hypothetical protein
MFSPPKIFLQTINGMGFRTLARLVKLSWPFHVGFVVLNMTLGQFFFSDYIGLPL